MKTDSIAISFLFVSVRTPSNAPTPQPTITFAPVTAPKREKKDKKDKKERSKEKKEKKEKRKEKREKRKQGSVSATPTELSPPTTPSIRISYRYDILFI